MMSLIEYLDGGDSEEEEGDPTEEPEEEEEPEEDPEEEL